MSSKRENDLSDVGTTNSSFSLFCIKNSIYCIRHVLVECSVCSARSSRSKLLSSTLTLQRNSLTGPKTYRVLTDKHCPNLRNKKTAVGPGIRSCRSMNSSLFRRLGKHEAVLQNIYHLSSTTALHVYVMMHIVYIRDNVIDKTSFNEWN